MPRFYLRDLFWLTLVVALIFAWWADHRQIAQYNEEMRAWLRLSIQGTRHQRREKRELLESKLGKLE